VKLKLKRVILFTNQMAELTAFYGEQLGMKSKIDPEYEASEWIEFDGGGTQIALHKAHGNGGGRGGGSCAHKLVFYASNVVQARTELIRKKVKMGAVKKFGTLVLCDGTDPDGNKIQVSNRR
jgi:hypothetical protein